MTELSSCIFFGLTSFLLYVRPSTSTSIIHTLLASYVWIISFYVIIIWLLLIQQRFMFLSFYSTKVHVFLTLVSSWNLSTAYVIWNLPSVFYFYDDVGKTDSTKVSILNLFDKGPRFEATSWICLRVFLHNHHHSCSFSTCFYHVTHLFFFHFFFHSIYLHDCIDETDSTKVYNELFHKGPRFLPKAVSWMLTTGFYFTVTHPSNFFSFLFHVHLFLYFVCFYLRFFGHLGFSSWYSIWCFLDLLFA